MVVRKKVIEDINMYGYFIVANDKCADVETYPLPKIEDIYEPVREYKVHSILDISYTYHQIPITEE